MQRYDFFEAHTPRDFRVKEIGEAYHTEKSPLLILNYEIEKLGIPDCLNVDDFKIVAHKFDTTLDKIIFMDIETTGLVYSTPIFLIGTLFYADNHFMIRQMFARDTEEEAGILHYYADFLKNFEVIVTFNGSTFDIPYIVDRSNRRDITPHTIAKHYDALKHSRKRWGKLLPNCTLQTLEKYVCKRKRTDDIPGHLIPRVYNEYLETGEWSLLDDIVYHNALDLITTAELLVYLFD